MLARIRKSMENKDQGFTLIELLVVMIIIGILAAIAIPTFLNQRNKGYDSQAKSDARSIQSEAETFYTDAQAYPTTISLSAQPATPAADTIYVKQSANSTITTTITTNTAKTKFCAQVTSKSGTVFKVSSAAAGVATGACGTTDVA
ncbi:type IV pilin protein [Kineococcus sp. SYSU DK002]|uniref:type IV pilin protein n=1 Tax=Kineococcus sp. SYSU DK002 TaxID=3383123 RepID=UPI003D7C3703